MVVRYTVQDAVAGDNMVMIALPVGWEPAYRPSGSNADDIVSDFGADLLVAEPPDASMMVSYAVLTTTLATNTATPVSLVDGVLNLGESTIIAATNHAATITARAPTGERVSMEKNAQVVVTYFNVKVPPLSANELTADRDPVDNQFTVTDSIIGPTTKYDAKAVIMVRPQQLSTVSASPPSVEDGTIVDVTVTYTAQDTVYSENMVTIGLPLNWEPAYEPYDGNRTFNSFGTSVRERVPRDAKRNTTSYVVLTTAVKSDTAVTDVTTDVTSSIEFDIANARVTVDIPGNTVTGDKITVTFHNVMVAENLRSESQDAQFTVTDSIVDSNYDVTVKVTPLKLGAVAVTPDDPVTAGGMVDLKVKYTATKVLSFGRIQVTLPTL